MRATNPAGGTSDRPTLPSVTKVRAFVRFSRPHTIIASVAQVIGLFVLAVVPGGAFPEAVAVLVWTLIAALGSNLYIVGLNQITDVAIDRINKPSLPLASGDFTPREGWAIVLVSGALALSIAALQSVELFLTLSLVMLLGTVYSVPPLRLKRQPVAAALCIALARGLIANLGLHAHFTATVEGSAGTLPLWIVLFFFGFGLVIALFKDIPDWTGDRRFAVRTFTVRWGPVRVFNIVRGLQLGLYLIPIAVALRLLPSGAGFLLLAAHLAAAGFFWWLSTRTAPTVPASVTRLYMALWGLFYAEYLFLSLFRIAGALA